MDRGEKADTGRRPDQDENAETAEPHAAEQAEKIAAEGKDLREQIRRLTQELFRERKLDFSELNDIVREVLKGASDGIERTFATQGEKGEALRQVYTGLAEAVAGAARSLGEAVEESRERGQKFAEEDVKKAFEQLNDLEKKFLDAVWQTAGSLGTFLKEQLQEVVKEARELGTQIGPAVKDASRSAAKEPFNFATQTAEAGIRAAAQSAGLLMQALGSFLEATGEILTERAGAQPKEGQVPKDENGTPGV